MFQTIFWLYHLLEIRVMLILLVFNCVHVSFRSFDDVFDVFWLIFGHFDEIWRFCFVILAIFWLLHGLLIFILEEDVDQLSGQVSLAWNSIEYVSLLF